MLSSLSIFDQGDLNHIPMFLKQRTNLALHKCYKKTNTRQIVDKSKYPLILQKTRDCYAIKKRT